MKEIHVNMHNALAVETFIDDEGFITGQTVHFAGEDAEGKGRKFSTADGQYCDPNLTAGMKILRGDIITNNGK